jgi:hypothetical protein
MEGQHQRAKFDHMRLINSLNLAPGALDKIATTLDESVESLTTMVNEQGVEKFKKFLDISFDFTSGGDVKNIHFSPDNPEIRLWLKSKNVQEPNGKSIVSTQVFTKEATDKVPKLPETAKVGKGKEEGGFEL